MPITPVVVSYDIADILGVDYDATRGRTSVYVSTNIPDGVLVDTDSNQIRLDGAKGAVATDGTGSVTLWPTNAATNPTAFQYYFTIDYIPRGAGKHEHKTLGPYSITAAADLADLVDEQEVPPTYLSTVTALLDEYVEQAEAAAALAEDISNIATPDALVETLIENPASLTSAALSATIDAAVEPLATDLAAVPAAIAAEVDPLRPVATFADLPKWSKALMDVRNGTADAKILVAGESTYAEFADLADFHRGIPINLASMLNSYFVPSAKGLCIPLSNIAGAVGPGAVDGNRWNLGSGWARVGGSALNYGFGGHSAYSNGTTTNPLVFGETQVTADTFDVFYMNGPAATFSVTATGGSTTTITTTGPLDAPSIRKVTVTAASASTTNTVTTARVSGGEVYILAVEPSLSTVKKVRVGGAGVQGTTAADWANDPTYFGAIPCIKAYAPHLTFICLGINSALVPETTPNFISNMQALITAAQISGDVILVTAPRSGDSRLSVELAYETALRALGLPILEFGAHMVSYAAYQAQGFAGGDNIHLNDRGNWDMTQQHFQALARVS